MTEQLETAGAAHLVSSAARDLVDASQDETRVDQLQSRDDTSPTG